MSRLVIIDGSNAGIPAPYQREAIKAWIVLQQGESLTDGEIQAFCGDKLVAYKILKQVEFRTELPKTLVGKFSNVYWSRRR
jgi:long-chain acyl-CoA synthetase